MNTDEKDIIDYLKGWSKNFVSGKEIARKVGGKQRFEEDRGWAIPVLAQMVRRGVLETDHLGYFRIKLEKDRSDRERRYVSPQMLKVLKSSGKSFGSFIIDEDSEEDLPRIKALPTSRPGDGSGNKTG